MKFFYLITLLSLSSIAHSQNTGSAGKEFVETAFKDLSAMSSQEKSKYTSVGQSILVKTVTQEEVFKILNEIKFPEACKVEFKQDGKALKVSMKLVGDKKLRERVKLTEHFLVTYSPKRTIYGFDFKGHDREEMFFLESGTPGESDRLALTLNAKGEYIKLSVADKDRKSAGMDVECGSGDVNAAPKVEAEVIKDSSRANKKERKALEKDASEKSVQKTSTK